MQQPETNVSSKQRVDEIDRARAQEYALIATLLSRSPDTEMIGRLALLRGDASPLGAAHAGLGEAARKRMKMIWHRSILIYLPAWEAARSCRIRPTI
jgi:hypothetical protein